MISPWLIYFIGIADRVGGVFAFISIASIMALAVGIGILSDSNNSLKALKIPFIIAIICGLIAIFTPSSKTVAAMVVIPPIVNNEQLQELPNNVLEFINEYLKDAKKSLKEKDV
jgi:hypothetical protein